MNRSKRFGFWSHSKLAHLLNMLSWSILWSSCSWCLMYSRITFSSRPTVYRSIHAPRNFHR